MTALAFGLAAFFLLCIPAAYWLGRQQRWQTPDRPGSDAQFARWLKPQTAADESEAHDG